MQRARRQAEKADTMNEGQISEVPTSLHLELTGRLISAETLMSPLVGQVLSLVP